jgi:putative ABC transport system permease protein
MVEVALALVLLLGAGLLVRSFLELRGVDPGFAPDRVLTLRTGLPRDGYTDPESGDRESWPLRAAAFDRLRGEVEALPGVRAAGFVLELPLDADRQGTGVAIEGIDFPEDFDTSVNITFATPGYFEAMGIPVRRGRGFTGADRADSEPVAVVNDAFARRFLAGEGGGRSGGRSAGQNPVGRTIYTGFQDELPRRVVGTVADVLHDTLGREPFPAVYVPYAQLPYSRALSLAVRTDVPPREALPAVTARLRKAEPGLVLSRPRTMAEIVGASVSTPRFLSLLLGAFAAVALTLAAVGVYGVISYTVRRRTREIGVRVALGAGRGAILAMVLRRGMTPVVLGLVLGLAGALGFHRLVERFLFQVSPTDPVLYAALPLFLAATALAACLVPASRATAVDPREALEET